MTVRCLSATMDAAYIKAASAMACAKPQFSFGEHYCFLLEKFGPVHAVQGEGEILKMLSTVAEVFSRELRS